MSVSGSSLERELEIAISLVRRAGQIALDHCGRVERLTKTHATTSGEAVTVADRAVQRAIIAGLAEHFPGEGIIGEESESGTGITADRLAHGGRNWVIDPIDGTNNYLAGLGNWAVCVGLLEAGMPVLGVVYDPSRDVMYAGARGVGASVDGITCRVQPSGLSAASLIMLTSSLLDSDGRLPEWVPRWFTRNTWKIRMLGSAALESALVGAGVAHAAITVNGKLWDCVAAAGFTMAAGGTVVSLEGASLFPFDVSNYHGRKVPFATVAPGARDELVRELKDR